MRSSPLPAATLTCIAAALVMTLPAAAAEEDQAVFNSHCRTCHTTKEGDNRLGPSLYKIFGRKAGSSPGYNYSDSLANSGIVWDEATLDRFITRPDSVVANNKMKPYSGLNDDAVRTRIIQYLKSQSDR